jgi:hypothetical protein
LLPRLLPPTQEHLIVKEALSGSGTDAIAN